MSEIKNDFCCLIISGFGAGEQSAQLLCEHLRDNGMDAFVTTPSGSQSPLLQQEHWIHGVRMEYLALRHTYRRIALIGLSLGGLLMIHLLDLRPAATVFINTPDPYKKRALCGIFREDLRPRIHGAARILLARHQLTRLAEKTQARGLHGVRCPALVLQTQDDAICKPADAESLFKKLNVKDKALRLYAEGGHNVLASDSVLAVYSDIFQFCSRIQAEGQPNM